MGFTTPFGEKATNLKIITMRTILTKLMLCTIFLIFCNFSYAATYYFSTSTGNDSRSASQAQNPSTPWKSIDKLNSIFHTLKPGDRVAFKAGETFYGTIHVNRSGTSGSPIVISSYGTGSKPIITSLVKLQDWKSVGNGVYESGHSSFGSKVNTVLLNDKPQEMGRYPNSDAPNRGYLTYDGSTSTSVSDWDLSSSPNWGGGEVVIRKNFWIIDKHKISSHSGTRINFPWNSLSSYTPTPGYGYFIQNHPNTLDQLGEWYYNSGTKKIRVFFGSSSPSSHSLAASTHDYLVTHSSSINHITFENLHLKGANKSAFSLGKSGTNVKIFNCEISHSGQDALQIEGISNFVLEQSKIIGSNNNGIVLRSSPHASIKNNLIKDTYLFPGHGESGDNNGMAIRTNSDNCTIEYNEVINTGYSGINFSGSNVTIKNNLIDNFCLTKNDGGGIYSHSGRNDHYKNRKVIGNIVLNGKGVKEGAKMSLILSKPQAEGIYLDDNVTDVEVSGNIVAHMTSKGIYLHNTNNIRLRDNIMFDNMYQLFLRNDHMGGQLENTTVQNNQFLSKDQSQNHIHMMTINDDIKKLASLGNNHYATPLMDDIRITTKHNYRKSNETDQIFNLKTWQRSYDNDWTSKTVSALENILNINKILGNNKFDNGTFDKILGYVGCSSCNTLWDNNNKLDGGSLKISSSGQSSASLVIGKLQKEKRYALKFSAKSNKTIAITTYLRQNDSPWETLSNRHNFEITTTRKDYETIFTSLADVQNARLMMNVKYGKDVELWVDNVEIHEVETEPFKPEDKILFEYNASKNAKKITLDGEYVDLKNSKYSGTVTIEPYSAILLINKSTSNSSKKIAPTVKITTPADNSQFNPGSEIVIKTEVKDPDKLVNKVEFFNGSSLIGTANSAPYSYTWKNVSSGNYDLRAKVTYNTSSEVLSSIVPLQVRSAASKAQNVSDKAGTFNSILLNTGSSSDATLDGDKFIGDSKHSSYYKGSTTYTYTESRASLRDVYKTERNSENLQYSIPVPNGVYTVKTYHNELWFGWSGPTSRVGRRVFDILIEGAMVKKGFDIFLENNNHPTELVFRDIEVTDGYLNIEMIASQNRASVSGIEITGNSLEQAKTQAQTSSSVSYNTGTSSNVTYQGDKFVGDYNNSSLYSSSNINSNQSASSDAIFQTERYGKNLKYSIPLPNGTYTVKTYHNELWFGKGMGAPSGSKGSRVFDISLEGKVVKSNFDLYNEGNKETILTFHDIEVRDEVLNLDMLASANNATISGISIIGTNSAGTANLRLAAETMVEGEENGVDQSEEAEGGDTSFKLYPNPATEKVILYTNKELGQSNILVHNMNGQLVDYYNPHDLSPDNGEYTIPIHHLQNGVYLITLTGQNGVIEQFKLLVSP